MHHLPLAFKAWDFMVALTYTQPRIIGLFTAMPLFNSNLVPGMIRLGVAATMGLLVAPVIVPVAHVPYGSLFLILILCKEAFVGFAIGYALSIPFWAFEAVGFFIDNQRGASISATLNPVTGNDSSPLGILFNQAFIVFFLVSGGFSILLESLYDSFALWPVFDWLPTLHASTVPLLLAQLDQLVRLAVLCSAPVIISMLLAELGLALVSRFVPQLQVFFLAMPIKSALALFVLVIYLHSMFYEGSLLMTLMRQIVPFLKQQWQPAYGAAS